MTIAEKKTLGKDERICSTKRIDKLFTSGDSFICYPLRIVYTKTDIEEHTAPVSIMVSVPKKKFKRAVKRNRVKRLVREAYRINKKEFFDLCQIQNIHLDIVFIFLKDSLPDFKEIEKAVLKTVQTLSMKLEGKNGE